MKIDFVIPWVDGADPVWIRERNLYVSDKYKKEMEIRYRDWDYLKYWFRGVEKFTPWVNQIHFITWGHIPEWLDVNHQKINIVKHCDYIPETYLPTFSSHTIELNLHRIDNLSEQFVYFNDDFYIINHMRPKDFFMNGLPCDEFVLEPCMKMDYENEFAHYLINAVGLVNKRINFKEQIKKIEHLIFDDSYKEWHSDNHFLSKYNFLTGFYTIHLPQPFLKSTIKDLWNLEEKILDTTSKNKFRSLNDVNQYLFRYWQLMNGQFSPSYYRKKGWAFHKPELEHEKIKSFLENQSRKMICINDSQNIKNFKYIRNYIAESFEKILPKKSSFEI